MKWYKNKSIVIKWFLVLLVLCVIVFWVVVLAVTPQYGPRKGDGYASSLDEIRKAVVYYQSKHDGSLPINNGTYTNAECVDCHVINISALLVANGGLLYESPVCSNLSASGNDNCGGNSSLGCNNYGSYIWIVDASGEVFSYCAGVNCATNNSGYQDWYP